MTQNEVCHNLDREFEYQNDYDRLVEEILETTNQELSHLIKIYEYIR